MRVVVELEEGDGPAPSAPFVSGAAFAAHLTYGVDQDGKRFDLVNIDTNRAGLKSLAYQLLAIAHSPVGCEDSHLHIHVTDDVYAVRNDAVAVTIHFDQALLET